MIIRSGMVAAFALVIGVAQADVFANQQPVSGGGVMRWSKLWVDPTGQNNLDGDAICYEDFVLNTAATINHIEWWGDPVPNQGFQIEFWKQDPGTVAYQPYGVFREAGALPEYAVTTTSFGSSADGSGTTHYTYDFASPVSLAANGGVNPRWFVAIIGLTDVPYLEWNWAQGTGGSNATFQFIRGGSMAGGDLFHVLPEGRAMVLSGSPVPEPGTLALLGAGAALIFLRRRRG